MILVIDNYDSFTYNLVHLIGAQGVEVRVVRNDALSVEDALALGPKGMVLSPGPCTPKEAGICVDMAKACRAHSLPLLGVCLGHQSITEAAGGTVSRASRQVHGKTSEVSHTQDPLFAGVPSPFTATRYHSLVAVEEDLPPDLSVIARADDDGEIMALRWGDGPFWGVQFHPESIASTFGDVLIKNFLATTNGKAQAA